MKSSFRKISERQQEILFLVLVGFFLFIWAAVQPFNFSPDEQMRYKVVDYIFRYNRLPHGGDPEVLDASWGISYAFYPMLSYMVSYLYMKLVGIFTQDFHAIVVAARMAEVTFGVVTAYFTMKIGKHFFKGAQEKLFLALVTCLPGAFVLFTYVNCDGLALMSTAMLIYGWIRGLENGWSKKTCVFIGVGVSCCALSYYNAYGVILATVVVFVSSILMAEEKKWNIKKLLQRGILITVVVAALAGWWFARNYVLYDGDILGLSITTDYAEKYAKEERKPSNRMTFQENPAAGVADMLLYQPENHEHNWTMMVYYSFIGSFGYMTIWPPEWIGKVFMLLFLVGAAGVLTHFDQLFYVKRVCFKEKALVCSTPVEVKYTYKMSAWGKDRIFHIGLLITMILPNVLNIYNSYCNDYQPQGRYSMPMLIPFMYFVVRGLHFLFEKSEKLKKIETPIYIVVSVSMIVFLLYCYFGLVLPSCP